MRLSYDVNGELANKIIIDWRKKKNRAIFCGSKCLCNHGNRLSNQNSIFIKGTEKYRFIKGFLHEN